MLQCGVVGLDLLVEALDCGDRDAAFSQLHTAVEDRDPNLLGLKSNPAFDSLRTDPRYAELLATMRLN